MPYGLREGTHVDPDGNVIRFASVIPAAHADEFRPPATSTHHDDEEPRGDL